MRRSRLVTLAFTAFCMAGASAAHAQATRTWVSGVGDDANPCSRTAPCKTFAGAISKTATAGVISVLDPGGFGAVTITKSITIDGGGIEGSILASFATGVIVNAATDSTVVLRGLTIYGASTGIHGIRVTGNAVHLSVENCVITDFTQQGIDVQNSGTFLYATNSLIRGNSGFGIFVRNSRATVENVRFENNADGVRAGSGGTATVRRSTASGHFNIGFSAVGASAVVNLEDSTASNNAWGIGAATAGTLRASHTAILNNTVMGIYNDGTSSLVSFGNNRVAGNATDGAFTSTTPLQ